MFDQIKMLKVQIYLLFAGLTISSLDEIEFAPKNDSHTRAHSGYITVVELYQLLCYWSNFSKLLLVGWFEVLPQRYDFHCTKPAHDLKI